MDTFSSIEDVRTVSQFTDTGMVSDDLINLRKDQAYKVICKYLISDIKTLVDDNDLDSDQEWDLRIGEAQLASFFICRSLALKFTLGKFNKEISSSQGGVWRDFDSRKNIDFNNLQKIMWEEAMETLSDYLEETPKIGNLGGKDPYTNAETSATLNQNWDKPYTDAQLAQIKADWLVDI